MTPRFAVEAVQLDPETGAAAASEPLVPRREFAEPGAWRAAVAELRRTLLTSP